MVTLVTDVTALLPRLPVFLSLWLPWLLTSAVLLPKLPEFLSLRLPWLLMSLRLYCYQGYQRFCRYGYFVVWRHHGCTVTKVTRVTDVAMVTLVNDVTALLPSISVFLSLWLPWLLTSAVLLPKLPEFLSLWLPWLLMSLRLYCYQNYQSFYPYGYLGYWCQLYCYQSCQSFYPYGYLGYLRH